MTDLKTLRQTLRDLAGSAERIDDKPCPEKIYLFSAVDGTPAVEVRERHGFRGLSLQEKNYEYYHAARPENILRLLDAIDEAEKALEECGRFGYWSRKDFRKEFVRALVETLDHITDTSVQALSKLRGGR